MLETVFQLMLTIGMECYQTNIVLLLRKRRISEDAIKPKGASFSKRFNLTFKVVIWKKVSSKSQSLKKNQLEPIICNALTWQSEEYRQNELHLN